MDVLLYVIAYYYVLLAAINDGFSGFYLGIPYAFFLIWDITRLNKNSIIRNIHIIILIFSALLIISDRGRLQIIYPMVGKTYNIVNDINYSSSSYYINYIDIHSSYSSDNENKIFQLKKGNKFHIERQIKTGNVDFGIDYIHELRSDEFIELNKYMAKNLKEIKARVVEKHYGNISVEESKFYYENKNKFYMNEYDMITLFKSQKIVYNKNRFENGFTYFSFYLLFYPVMEVFFVLLLLYRNRKI